MDAAHLALGFCWRDTIDSPPLNLRHRRVNSTIGERASIGRTKRTHSHTQSCRTSMEAWAKPASKIGRQHNDKCLRRTSKPHPRVFWPKGHLDQRHRRVNCDRDGSDRGLWLVWLRTPFCPLSPKIDMDHHIEQSPSSGVRQRPHTRTQLECSAANPESAAPLATQTMRACGPSLRARSKQTGRAAAVPIVSPAAAASPLQLLVTSFSAMPGQLRECVGQLWQ